MTATVGAAELTAGVAAAGVAGQAVCVHGSLRSFGRVEGGAAMVIAAFLDAGCTVLAPTFADDFQIPPPPGMRPPRNGWTYADESDARPPAPVFTPDSPAIDPDMGAIPAALLTHPGRVRGEHPLNSFTAVGPRAAEIAGAQHPLEVYAPLAALAELDGSVALLGVGLSRMTLLHLAEQRAGREPFRRWALDRAGAPAMVQTGGCSEGFPRLEPHLAPLRHEVRVGDSRWIVFRAREVLAVAAQVIRNDPGSTRCDDPSCERCRDAALGGPLVRSA